MDDLEKLKKEYILSMKDKVAKIQTQIQILATQLDSNKKPSWESLTVLIHKMSGSSGTYGLMEISQHCRTLEDQFINGSVHKLPAKLVKALLNEWLSTLNVFLKKYTADGNKAA